MRFLLDTHAFLWWITQDERLSRAASDVIAGGENELWFSVASAWEIVVKAGLGRLTATDPLEDVLPNQLERNAIQVLPIHLRHTLALSRLPDVHRDPFDRILIAQSIVEKLAIVSGDRAIAAYPVERVW